MYVERLCVVEPNIVHADGAFTDHKSYIEQEATVSLAPYVLSITKASIEKKLMSIVRKISRNKVPFQLVTVWSTTNIINQKNKEERDIYIFFLKRVWYCKSAHRTITTTFNLCTPTCIFLHNNNEIP